MVVVTEYTIIFKKILLCKGQSSASMPHLWRGYGSQRQSGKTCNGFKRTAIPFQTKAVILPCMPSNSPGNTGLHRTK